RALVGLGGVRVGGRRAVEGVERCLPRALLEAHRGDELPEARVVRRELEARVDDVEGVRDGVRRAAREREGLEEADVGLVPRTRSLEVGGGLAGAPRLEAELAEASKG